MITAQKTKTHNFLRIGVLGKYKVKFEGHGRNIQIESKVEKMCKFGTLVKSSETQ
jgi:hypothetical protein